MCGSVFCVMYMTSTWSVLHHISQVWDLGLGHSLSFSVALLYCSDYETLSSQNSKFAGRRVSESFLKKGSFSVTSSWCGLNDHHASVLGL